MTEDAPASAFELRHPNTRRQKTPLDLHQTTVQIRDAILQLRGYFHDIAPSQADLFVQRYSIPTHQHDAALAALQLANAIHTKAAGASPTPVDTTVILQSRSTNLEQETAELLRLARWWPHALQDAHPSTNAMSEKRCPPILPLHCRTPAGAYPSSATCSLSTSPSPAKG
jgi:hypothetical protein